MRIAYVTDTREIGGAERYLVNLAQPLARDGHEVVLLAPQQRLVQWLAREAPAARVERAFSDGYHDAATSARRAAALFALLPRLVRTLRELAPEVVHVNNGGFPGSDLCRLTLPAARLAGVQRRLMTVHSNPWPRTRLADPRVQAVADRLTWSSVHTVISPSEAVATGLRTGRGMPASRSRTIYYGVAAAASEAATVAAIRERLAPDGELLAGMVSARPVPEKGYEVFVDALARAEGAVRGVLVGAPPHELPRHLQAVGLQGRLALEGPRREVGSYYAAFDVLVVPSTAEECMPLVMLEAASVGTPTFASRLAGIPEAIADGVGGRLFEPGDAARLAALLDAAARDRRGTAALGRVAHERWRREFQLESMVRSTLSLYETADDRTARAGVPAAPGLRYTASR